jgi:predicted  nucleic acid-binding Zn-ribbon protein
MSEGSCEGCWTCGAWQFYQHRADVERAAESERDALRAEVEVMRRAVEWVLRKTVDSMDCPPEFRGDVICDGPSNSECVKCVMKWAISEARKGDEG